ncbi:ZIP family metal transporter [Peptacetobacter sp.]|uniref:ZIP family metal transporter n=1 Tax=Peptacetobacter sp. TaxID=2991975 RepID=UPI00260B1D7C|nr:ZIP family metal transporter [Peptacetobacter sp.]
MIIKITLIGLIIGVIGTGIGGILAVIFNEKASKYMKFFMGLSGGIMLSIVSFDLIPEATESIGLTKSILLILIGAVLTKIIKEKVKINGENSSGYLMLLSIIMHNLPEGLAIGTTFLAEPKRGIAMATAIGIHNLPEGLALALGFICNKANRKKAIIMSMIAGLPIAVGCFVGAAFGSIFVSITGILLSLAAGMMLYVVLDEMIPESKSIYTIVGFLIGIIIVNMVI